MYRYWQVASLFDVSLTCYFIYCYLIHFFSLQLQCQVLENRDCFLVSLKVLGHVFCCFFRNKYVIILTSILWGNRMQLLKEKRKEMYAQRVGEEQSRFVY